MTPHFDELQKQLSQLPGLGYRSAERLALHLLVEQPKQLKDLVTVLQSASASIRPCSICGHLCESESNTCTICLNPKRNPALLCIVERSPDLLALEKSGTYTGLYHVLHGKLSPMNYIGPESLNIRSLPKRLEAGTTKEVILALSNDMEGEATCHYLQEYVLKDSVQSVTRIGFGLPNGANLIYADAVTLKNAMEGRRTAVYRR